MMLSSRYYMSLEGLREIKVREQDLKDGGLKTRSWLSASFEGQSSSEWANVEPIIKKSHPLKSNIKYKPYDRWALFANDEHLDVISIKDAFATTRVHVTAVLAYQTKHKG
jgi:hypothetical protein